MLNKAQWLSQPTGKQECARPEEPVRMLQSPQGLQQSLLARFNQSISKVQRTFYLRAGVMSFLTVLYKHHLTHKQSMHGQRMDEVLPYSLISRLLIFFLGSAAQIHKIKQNFNRDNTLRVLF